MRTIGWLLFGSECYIFVFIIVIIVFYRSAFGSLSPSQKNEVENSLLLLLFICFNYRCTHGVYNNGIDSSIGFFYKHL
jgi:hypothetical protein